MACATLNSSLNFYVQLSICSILTPPPPPPHTHTHKHTILPLEGKGKPSLGLKINLKEGAIFAVKSTNFMGWPLRDLNDLLGLNLSLKEP